MKQAYVTDDPISYSEKAIVSDTFPADTTQTGVAPQSNLPLREAAHGHKESESHFRSLAKALSWRAIAFTITASIVWGATGELSFAAMIGALDATLKIGAYYLHERAWIFSNFGFTNR